MATNDSKINDEIDLLGDDDSFRSANVATGIGGRTTASETFDRVGTAASGFNDAGARTLDARVGESPINRAADFAAADEMADDSPLRWLAPLIVVALLIILGYTFCGGSHS